MPIMPVDLAIGLEHFGEAGGDVTRKVEDAAILNVGVARVVFQMMVESCIGRTEETQRIPPGRVFTAAPIDPVP